MPREPEDTCHSDECPSCEGDDLWENGEEVVCEECKGDFVCECRDCRNERRDEQERDVERQLEEAYARGDIRED